jgi:hypothetical protein
MSEMVERVARALAKEDGKDPDAPAWVRYPGPEAYGICWRDQYVGKAMSAINAMLEPTDAMVEAAWTCTKSVSAEERMASELFMDSRALHAAKMKARWSAMVKAALSKA